MFHFVDILRSCFISIHKRPIIVLGNQKSGTSVIANLLADYGGLTKTIDIPILWPPLGIKIMKGETNFEKVVNQYRYYFRTDLIKEPMLTFFVDQVVRVFPNAKFLLIVRDPRDNIRSLLNRRNIPGNLDRLERKYIPKSPNHRIVADSNIWGGEGENYIGVLANRWNLAVSSYFRYPEFIQYARYEDFIEDKVGYIARLAKIMEIDQKQDIQAMKDFQFQPLGDRKISWEEFFGQNNLLTIERICKIEMHKFGYASTGLAKQEQ